MAIWPRGPVRSVQCPWVGSLGQACYPTLNKCPRHPSPVISLQRFLGAPSMLASPPSVNKSGSGLKKGLSTIELTKADVRKPLFPDDSSKENATLVDDPVALGDEVDAPG